jgi:hypothetical protein
MARDSVPELVVDERIEVGLSLLGVIAVAAAAYHTAQTGNWRPLMATSAAVTLVVLFVTSAD